MLASRDRYSAILVLSLTVYVVSLSDLHMQPNPEVLQKIHNMIKQLGLDQVTQLCTDRLYVSVGVMCARIP